MEILSDLDSFANTLYEKGYTGHFVTEGAYPDRIKESLEAYLQSCAAGRDTMAKDFIHLRGYLKWKDEDSPNTSCCMYIKYLNDKFFLDRIVIERGDRFQTTLGKAEFTGLSVVTAPTAKEAIASVQEKPMQKASRSFKRSRF